MEISKQIEIPASNISREDVGADAEQVLKASKEVQSLVAFEAENLLNIAAGSSEATISDNSKGIPDTLHSDKIIVVESDSTPSISSETSSSSLDLDDIPLG